MPHLLPRDSLIEIAFAPILWILFFLVAYTTVGAGCILGLSSVEVLGLDGVRGTILLEAIVLGALLFAGGAVLFLRARDGRRRSLEEAREEGEEKEREPRKHRRYFLALASLCLTGMMLLGTLWVLFAVSLVPVC